ncbi:hypothetical protein C8R43DRAFT_1132196 [Mycena crocata]|nr:hypothetical protein C8R43DRAFT_1132196 [Mycena crocata]
MPTRPQDFRYRLMTHQVLVIAASPPPPPTTTSTPAQPFNRLRNVSFSSIPPLSSSGWRHNVFKPSYGLISSRWVSYQSLRISALPYKYRLLLLHISILHRPELKNAFSGPE